MFLQFLGGYKILLRISEVSQLKSDSMCAFLDTSKITFILSWSISLGLLYSFDIVYCFYYIHTVLQAVILVVSENSATRFVLWKLESKPDFLCLLDVLMYWIRFFSVTSHWHRWTQDHKAQFADPCFDITGHQAYKASKKTFAWVSSVASICFLILIPLIQGVILFRSFLLCFVVNLT